MTQWFVLAVNPDPWAIGPVGVGRKNGKMYPYVGRNNQLHDYQQAVKEALTDIEPLSAGEYDLRFYFWRRLDEHASGKKHYADATNLQKSTEDALQGVLFDNDRLVRRVGSEIVEQSATAEPCIVIAAELYVGNDPREIPEHIWEQIDRVDSPPLFDNTWGGPDA